MSTLDAPDSAVPWNTPSPPMPSSYVPERPRVPPPPAPGTRVEAMERPGVELPRQTPKKTAWWLAGSVAVFVAVAVLVAGIAAREPSWDPAVERYVAFVEAERGLTFDHPVDVRWADISAELEAEFAAERALTSTAEPVEDPYGVAYHLLGLVAPAGDVPLAESIDDTAAENAGAFYEPWTETIVLPIDAHADALGYTIVHELTHALQHQNGMLDWHDDSPDSAAARRSLTEGDAERIAVAWFDQLTPAAQDRYFDAIGYDPDAQFPDPGDRYLETTFNVPYSIGLPMVRSIVESEGVGELDRLLRSVEVGTTERLIDVLGDGATSSSNAVDELDLGSDELADGDLGALTWFRALAPTIGTEAALNAVVGYDDDAFTIDADACGSFAVTFDSGHHADEFAAGLDALRSKQSVIVEESSVLIELCDPIGNPGDQRFGTIMPIVVLNEMTFIHLRNGMDADIARCVALAQASMVAANEPVSSFVGWEALDDAAPGFLEVC